MVSDGFVLAFAERMAVAPDCCCQKRMASWSQRFGYGACAEAEAVGQTVVRMELSGDAEGRETFKAALHGTP